jgi:porin
VRLWYLISCAVINGLVPLAAADPARSSVLEEPNQYVSPTVMFLQDLDSPRFYGDWPWGSDGLTGNWGGARSWLERKGVRLFGQYTAISMVNFRGGLAKGYYGGAPLGITLTADLGRLAGIPGASVFVDWEYFQWYSSRFAPTGARDPTGSFVGDNTNLIDADDPVPNQVAQLYWNQELFDGVLDVQFGKMDVNATFVSVAAAGAFQNSIAMFTSTLNEFMSTYPEEATGLQLAVQPTDSVQALLGWFDGTSAAFDPATGGVGPATGPRGPSTFFENDGHWFLVAEGDVDWQLDPTRPGTAGLGGWVQTGRSVTAGSSPSGVTDVPGFYLQGTQTLWTESASLADLGGGVRLFGQFGWSTPSKNPVHWSIMAGLSATGVIPQRPADAVGLLGSHSRFSDDPAIFRSTGRDGAPATSGGGESAVEAFYLAQLLPWLYVQPGVEWIGTPGGGSPAPLADALVGYLLVNVQL